MKKNFNFDHEGFYECLKKNFSYEVQTGWVINDTIQQVLENIDVSWDEFLGLVLVMTNLKIDKQEIEWFKK